MNHLVAQVLYIRSLTPYSFLRGLPQAPTNATIGAGIITSTTAGAQDTKRDN